MKIDKNPVVTSMELKPLPDRSMPLDGFDVEMHDVSDQFVREHVEDNCFLMASGKRTATCARQVREEEDFIKAPTVSVYGKLAKNFVDSYKIPYNEKFYSLEHILISPADADDALEERYTFDQKRDRAFESWNEEEQLAFAHDAAAHVQHAAERRRKIQEKGLGIGGALSKPVYHGKEVGHFTRNNLMLKGYIYKAGDAAFGKTIFELLPNFKARKAKIVGIRLSETAIEVVLEGAGLALAPFTLGISKVVSNQLNNVVTLSGEAMLSKVKGAEPKKIAMQTALRGVQLEMPTGQIVNIAERGTTMVSTLSILGSFLADLMLRHWSTRYTGYIHPSQLGNSDVLYELNQRIDYLAQFLIPYGKLMLLRTKSAENKSKLRFILAEQYKILRNLEQSKTKALHFYHGALLDERLPEKHRQKIESDIDFACPDTRKNSHKMAARCFYTLLARMPEQQGDIEMTDLAS